MSSTWDEDDLWEEPPSRSGRTITPLTRREIFDLPARRVVLLVRAGLRAVLPRPSLRPGVLAVQRVGTRLLIATSSSIASTTTNWEDDWIFTDSRLQLASGPDDVAEFLSQLVHLVVPDTNEAQQIVQDLNNFLRPDGWQLARSGQMSGQPIFKPTRVNQGASVAIRSAHEVAAKVDSAYISHQVTRMEEAIESDPELAIGTAKEFIETVCKTILDGRGAEYERNDDVLVLVRKATKALRISRDDVDLAAEAADTIRRILSNLAPGPTCRGICQASRWHLPLIGPVPKARHV